jgi:hypothetical protein
VSNSGFTRCFIAANGAFRSPRAPVVHQGPSARSTTPVNAAPNAVGGLVRVDARLLAWRHLINSQVGGSNSLPGTKSNLSIVRDNRGKASASSEVAQRTHNTAGRLLRFHPAVGVAHSHGGPPRSNGLGQPKPSRMGLSNSSSRAAGKNNSGNDDGLRFCLNAACWEKRKAGQLVSYLVSGPFRRSSRAGLESQPGAGRVDLGGAAARLHPRLRRLADGEPWSSLRSPAPGRLPVPGTPYQ